MGHSKENANQEFTETTRRRLLLWSDRHCCLCKKPCGIDIILHHIQPKGKQGSNEEDNGIPLCYECHARVEHYNESHPSGTKYRHEELKRRRQQVFEKFTSHLVPRITYKITQQGGGSGCRKLPDVGFILAHNQGSYPARIGVRVRFQVRSRRFSVRKPYYAGSRLWHLNPGIMHLGHFNVPRNAMTEFASGKRLTAVVDITIRDTYDMAHELLPVAWTFKRTTNDWYFEPSPPGLRA